MIGKTMMIAAFAMAAAATPALAQMDNGQMANGMMPSQSTGMMGNNSMAAGKPSKSEMASMKHCKMMSSTAMAKSRKCTMLMQKYPDPTDDSATSTQ